MYCIFLGQIHSGVFLDDAGFILRYLDNVDQGYFFCYNVEEGPISGISGFLHGALTSLIAVISSSESALLISNYLGLFFLAFLTTKILSADNNPWWLVVPFSIAILIGSNSLLLVSLSGMETPLHIAVILAGIFFYMNRRTKLMWIFLALSVISKLDAVPIAVIVGLASLIPDFKSRRASAIQEAMWYGILPVALWALIAFLLFGSILPHSASTKLFIFEEAGGHWFPFIKYYTEYNHRLIVFSICLFVFLADLIVQLTDKELPRRLLPGLCGFGVLILYYFYNPHEKMLWYYSLPSFLFLLQGSLSIISLSKTVWKRGPYIAPAIPLILFFIVSADMRAEFHNRSTRIYDIETERSRIGEYVAKHSTEAGYVLSGHGLIARKAKGIVIDYTGLNSEIAAEHKLDNPPILRKYKPSVVVFQQYIGSLDMMSDFNYSIGQTWYEISSYGGEPWSAYLPMEKSGFLYKQYRPAAKSFTTDNVEQSKNRGLHRIIAKDISFTRDAPGWESYQFHVGVFRKLKPFEMEFTSTVGDSVIARMVYQVPGLKDEPIGNTYSIQFATGSNAGKVRIKGGKGLDRRFELINPVWVDRKKE